MVYLLKPWLAVPYNLFNEQTVCCIRHRIHYGRSGAASGFRVYANVWYTRLECTHNILVYVRDGMIDEFAYADLLFLSILCYVIMSICVYL